MSKSKNKTKAGGATTTDPKAIFLQALCFDHSASVLGRIGIDRIRSLENTPQFPVVGPAEECHVQTAGGLYLPSPPRTSTIVRMEGAGNGLPDVPTLIPHIVLYAFAIELYFKCIITIESGDPWGHSLLELFNQLSTSSKDRIGVLYQSNLDSDDNIAGIKSIAPDYKFGLIDCITESSDTFVKWRYHYEDQTIRAVHAGTPHARIAARGLILELKAEWEPLARSMGY